MRKHPFIVALTVAGIIAGTGAGIAAIGGETIKDAALDAAAQVEARPAVAQATMPAEAGAPAVAPVTEATTAAESSTSVPLTPVAPVAPVAQAPAESVVQPQSQPMRAPKSGAEPRSIATRASGDEYYVRIPFTKRQVKVTVPTFPGNSAEYPEVSPSVIAYFDRKNGNTVLAGATGPVFPSGGGGDDAYHPVSPAVVAYFDRIEANRLAAIKAATPAVAVAPPVVTPDSAVASLSSATASTAGTATPATAAPTQ
jgi:hypothetical protein